MGHFILGTRSKKELVGVDSGLVILVENALRVSSVDFGVTDGLRTEAEQRELVARGASKTMKSKHLEGRAVDLVPFLNGKYRWEWPVIYEVAQSVHKACTVLGTNVRWGAVWDRKLLDLDPLNLEGEVEAYVERRRNRGRKAFLDGPHYELL